MAVMDARLMGITSGQLKRRTLVSDCEHGPSLLLSSTSLLDCTHLYALRSGLYLDIRRQATYSGPLLGDLQRSSVSGSASVQFLVEATTLDFDDTTLGEDLCLQLHKSVLTVALSA